MKSSCRNFEVSREDRESGNDSLALLGRRGASLGANNCLLVAQLAPEYGEIEGSAIHRRGNKSLP